MTIQRFSFMLNERTENFCIGRDKDGLFVTYEDHLAVVEQLEYELRYLREEETRLHDYIANLEYYVAEHALMNEKEPVY